MKLTTEALLKAFAKIFATHKKEQQADLDRLELEILELQTTFLELKSFIDTLHTQVIFGGDKYYKNSLNEEKPPKLSLIK